MSPRTVCITYRPMMRRTVCTLFVGTRCSRLNCEHTLFSAQKTNQNQTSLALQFFRFSFLSTTRASAAFRPPRFSLFFVEFLFICRRSTLIKSCPLRLQVSDVTLRLCRSSPFVFFDSLSLSFKMHLVNSFAAEDLTSQPTSLWP